MDANEWIPTAAVKKIKEIPQKKQGNWGFDNLHG